MVSATKRWELFLRAKNQPKSLHYSELIKLAESYGFVETEASRRRGGSHRVYALPGTRCHLTFQADGKMAKPYQVRQCVDLIEEHVDPAPPANEEDR